MGKRSLNLLAILMSYRHNCSCRLRLVLGRQGETKLRQDYKPGVVIENKRPPRDAMPTSNPLSPRIPEAPLTRGFSFLARAESFPHPLILKRISRFPGRLILASTCRVSARSRPLVPALRASTQGALEWKRLSTGCAR
jgi:hypothetical protein